MPRAFTAIVLVGVCAPAIAQAEPTSFLYLGGGVSHLKLEETSTPFALQLDTGYATPATSPVIVGGLFNFVVHAQHGVDLGASLRFTHPSFALGNFGAALDLGFYQRFWGQDSTGGSVRIALGGPWGVTLGVGATLGTHEQQTYLATLGFDFARLTVQRTTGQNWWRNPLPPETASR